MVRIAPFRGVFYNQKKIRDLAKVVTPPYDVISPEEQEKLYRKSPYNFVRLDFNQELGPLRLRRGTVAELASGRDS